MSRSRSLVVLRLAVTLAGLALLAGCHRGGVSCAKPGLYAQAQSLPPLRIPAGLDAPDTRGALRIPELNEPEVPRPTVSPCLEEPPKYSGSARLEPPPKEKGRKRDKASAPPAAPPAPPGAPAPAAPAP
jgi:hypothetical protein